MSWDDAKNYCENIVGWPLVAVNDRRVLNHLADFMERGDFRADFGNVWTGITQWPQNQSWYWIDETPYTGKLSAL